MAHKRNIALVYVDDTLPSSPLSLGDIAAYALTDEDVRREVDIKIFHLPRNPSCEKEVQLILQIDPIMVGFSAYSWNFHTLKIIAQMIKQARNEIFTVFGGPNVSGNKRTKECIRKYSFIDFIIEREGEIGFLQLLKTVLKDPDNLDGYKEVSNLSFRYNGNPISNPISPGISNLDEIPSPYMMNILNPHPGPVIWETNRGCPYRCAYCYWGNAQSKLYKYSIERLEEELRWFARNKVHFFWIADANFGIMPRDMEIVEIFCRINNEYERPFKNFGVNWAKNNVNRIVDIADILMKDRVECSLTIAYQTLTDEATRLSERKSLSIESGSQILQIATEKKIPVYTDLIWGLPGESLSGFLKSIDKVVDVGIPSINIHPLEVIPGTKFFEEIEKFGLELLTSKEHSQELVLSHPRMSITDHQRGVVIIHAHHLFHTFKTCHFVNRYLDLTLDIKHSQVCEAFLGYVEENNERAISTEAQLLRDKIFKGFTTAGRRQGANIGETINMIAYAFWDHRKAAEELLLDFYHEFLSTSLGKNSAEQWEKIHELLRFNLLIAPKPGWSSKEAYSFTFDVGLFYQEIMWHWVFAASTSNIPKLEKRTCSYRFDNFWLCRPINNSSEWTRAIAGRMCRFKEVHQT